jgi:hypothetical protein
MNKIKVKGRGQECPRHMNKIKVKGRGRGRSRYMNKIKVKGRGQECPRHMNKRRRCEWAVFFSYGPSPVYWTVSLVVPLLVLLLLSPE